jgi:hypothetical protein
VFVSEQVTHVAGDEALDEAVEEVAVRDLVRRQVPEFDASTT